MLLGNVDVINISWVAEKAIDSNRGLKQLTIRDAPQPLLRLTHGGGWICVKCTELVKCSSLTENTAVELSNGAEIRIGNSLENNGNNPM